MKPLDARSFKIVPGRYYDTPKELWGFRSEPGSGTPEVIARAFLEANRNTLGIDLTTLERKKLYVILGPGACQDACSSVFTSKREFDRAIREKNKH